MTTKPKYATCDQRFWWKKDKWDTLDVLHENFKEAEERMRDMDNDTVIVEIKGEELIPLTKKPKLTNDEERVCRIMYS